VKKSFLIIQIRPEDETSDSEFEAIKRHGGLEDREVQRARIERDGLPSINLDDYAAIIVGGSPFDVSTPEADKSDIQKKIENGFNSLFDDIVARDFPFMGCCSGNGLLGSYCGSPISKRYGEPVGGADIFITEEGKKDKLLEGMPASIRVLLGHKEACDITPPNSVLLASNESCPVQMFRLKQNIYATQFHPEGDSDEFTVRIHVYKSYGYFPAEKADDLLESIEAERGKVDYAHAILKRFVDFYRAAS
jgi:GMP synthase (glutamine-hydrolysing)